MEGEIAQPKIRLARSEGQGRVRCIVTSAGFGKNGGAGKEPRPELTFSGSCRPGLVYYFEVRIFLYPYGCFYGCFLFRRRVPLERTAFAAYGTVLYTTERWDHREVGVSRSDLRGAQGVFVARA